MTRRCRRGRRGKSLSSRGSAAGRGPSHGPTSLRKSQRQFGCVSAQGRRGSAGVDRPQPLAQQAPGGAQAAAGVQDLPAGPGLLDPGPGQGLADLVVVLDQDLDPGVHAVDGRLDAGRLGPQTGDLPGRGLARGGHGGLVVDAAEGDAEEHEDDEELPKLAQGEVPSTGGSAAGRGPSHGPLPSANLGSNSAAAPPGVVQNSPGIFPQDGPVRVPRTPRRRRTTSRRRLSSSTRRRRATAR